MKRISIAGLTLMAVFAFCALATSAASAATPLCLQVDIPNTGNFNNSFCSGTPAHGQEWVLAKVVDKRSSWPWDLWCASVDAGFTSQVLGWNTLEECVEEPAPARVNNASWTRVKNVRLLGPGYVVGNCGCGVVLYLEAGQTANVTTKNLGDFSLVPNGSGEPTTLCTGLSAPTTIKGGGPGTSETTIEFTGCTATGSGGSGTCDSLSVGQTPGNISVATDDELVYVGSEGEAKKEEGNLGDLFTPASGGKTFVTLLYLALSGSCPTGAVETAVEGSVIGLVEPVNTVSKQGMLTFPSTAIAEGWQWLSAGKVHKVKAGLKAFVIVTATQEGLADLELASGNEWGALTS